MNKLLLVGLLGLSVVAATGLFSEEQYQDAFVGFMAQYSKKYTHDMFFQRYNVFKANLDFIAQHNSGNSSFTVGMNAFGDLTAAEFAATHTGYIHIDNPYLRSKNAPQERRPQANPASVDWRPKAVTGVKNQGQCGSCWSFSSTGAIEGVWAIKGNTLVSLSEQQLVDCSSAQGNQGCNGGWMDSAFQYVIKNKGITGETDYVYTAKQGTCAASGKTIRATISSFKDVTVNSDASLETAVATNPVSVALEADKSSFQFYSGGVYSDAACGTTLDHAVLVVGYATSGATKYWIVKNSWGTSWGASGYIMIARGTTNSGKGVCGINSAPSYPVV